MSNTRDANTGMDFGRFDGTIIYDVTSMGSTEGTAAILADPTTTRTIFRVLGTAGVMMPLGSQIGDEIALIAMDASPNTGAFPQLYLQPGETIIQSSEAPIKFGEVILTKIGDKVWAQV